MNPPLVEHLVSACIDALESACTLMLPLANSEAAPTPAYVVVFTSLLPYVVLTLTVTAMLVSCASDFARV